MRAGDVQLLIRHVDTGDMAGRANQLGEGEHITSGAIIFRGHVIMHGGEGGGDMGWRAGGRRAGIGLEIRRAGQGFPVIGLHHILHLVHVDLRIDCARP